MADQNHDLTLFGVAHSRAYRCIWMLREIGVDYSQVEVDFFKGEQFAPDFLAVNPNARMPALQTPDGPLFESLAINLYLAKAYNGPLSLKDGWEEALAIQWSLWAATEIETPFLVILANTHMFPEEDRDANEKQIAEEKVCRPLTALNSQLKETGFLIGDRFTVADLNVASVLIMARLADFDFAEFPEVGRWLDAALERPSVRDYGVMKIKGPRPDFWQSIIM